MNEQHPIDEVLLSQLADGELESDAANDVLLDVLDNSDAREKLKEHLHLRKKLGLWRRSRPTDGEIHVPQIHADNTSAHAHLFRKMGSLAAAAVIGGLLVTVGFLAAKRSVPAVPPTIHPEQVVVVSPAQMTQLAQEYRLHESVAGPLQWYASDDKNIRLASVRGTRASGKPVAVVLRFKSSGASHALNKTYTIVCRDDQSATIEFPQANGASTVRLHLLPGVRDEKVNIRYAITVDGPEPDPKTSVALSGQRLVGLDHTSLGQLALADELVNVDASAWVIPKGLK